MQAVGKWSVFDLGIARVKGLEDLIEQGLGLRLELFQAVLMLAAGCGSVHGVHKTKALQGTFPSFDWCVYGKLVGVLLQCLLNGVKLLATLADGLSAAGRCMFAAACLSLLPTCCSLTSCATFCMFSGLTAISTAVLTA